MTDKPIESLTEQDLADPSITRTQLFEIARARSDLHPQILRHPRIYDGLRDWIHFVNASAEAVDSRTTVKEEAPLRQPPQPPLPPQVQRQPKPQPQPFNRSDVEPTGRVGGKPEGVPPVEQAPSRQQQPQQMVSQHQPTAEELVAMAKPEKTKQKKQVTISLESYISGAVFIMTWLILLSLGYDSLSGLALIICLVALVVPIASAFTRKD